MDIRLADFAGPFLTSATRAQMVCTEIFARWDNESVTLDFSDTRTITPSFANTLMLNMLHLVPLDEVRDRVHFVGMAPHVEQAIARAIERHESLGLGLSAYMTA